METQRIFTGSLKVGLQPQLGARGQAFRSGSGCVIGCALPCEGYGLGQGCLPLKQALRRG